jgi:hypothetical protein
MPSMYARSKIVPTTWNADQVLGPAARRKTRIVSPLFTTIGSSLYCPA